MRNPKTIFIISCFLMALVNGYMGIVKGGFNIDTFIGSAVGGSLLAIPIWSCIGVVLANIGVFFYKVAKPDNQDVLNIWQKASLGIITGIILKPLLGIIW